MHPVDFKSAAVHIFLNKYIFATTYYKLPRNIFSINSIYNRFACIVER